MGYYVTFFAIESDNRERFFGSLASSELGGRKSIWKTHRRKSLPNLFQIEDRRFQKIIDSQTPALLSTFPHFTIKNFLCSIQELESAVIGKPARSGKQLSLPNGDGYLQKLRPATIRQLSSKISPETARRILIVFDGDREFCAFFTSLIQELSRLAGDNKSEVFFWEQGFAEADFSVRSFGL